MTDQEIREINRQFEQVEQLEFAVGYDDITRERVARRELFEMLEAGYEEESYSDIINVL